MSVAKAIEALSTIATDLIVLPESDDYVKVIGTYLSTFESDLKPAAFALPKNAEEVSAILKKLIPIAETVAVAVCGAGQQPASGVANVAGGITIHMHRFTGVQLSEDRSFVSIAPGETWGNVYAQLEPEGLAVSGSRASTSGIGGLATHGGISFFSSERGFIVDDVVNYEVALANGDVVSANAENNSDLFKALKGGGGSNFGIITRFDFKTFKQGKMWGGRFMYFPQSFPQQLDHLAEYLNSNPDPKAQVRINIGYAHQVGGIKCMNDPTYTKPEKPEAFAAFTDIEPRVPQVDTLRIGTVSDMANEQSAQSEYNKRVIYLTTTLKASPAVLKISLDNFYTGYEALRSAAELVFAATYEPYPTSLLTIGAGRNSLGISPEDGPLVLFLLYVSWTDPKDDDMVIQASKDTLDRIQQAAPGMGQLHRYVYMNYAFPGQDPVASYGDEVRRELRAVSEKYDPMGFFQKAVSGGFKLS